MDTSTTRRAFAVMAGYGFVAGLPFPLSGFTLRQWLSEGGTSLVLIGLTANVGISYSLKFLWAPALDRLRPPGVLARLGQRRGWLMLVQPLLVAACVALALGNPAHPWLLIGMAAAVALLSATQDIGIDAWRIEMFPERMQGSALAAYVWGYRAALLVAGSAAIGVAGRLGWHGALLSVAALVALGPILTWMAPMPRTLAPDGELSLRRAVVAPIAEFLRRPAAAATLAFIMLFKLGEAMAGTMAPPFYRSLGYDRAVVAGAIGVPALLASLLGAAVGGALVAHYGAKRALILTGFVQMASMGLYFVLAYSGGNWVILVAKVVLEGFAEAMADAAFLTFLSSLCAPGFSATQYALLSSLAVVPLRTVGGLSGLLAVRLGWLDFYAVAIFAAVPAMLIMLRLVWRGAAMPAVAGAGSASERLTPSGPA